jgi:hypothetical protein
MTLGRAGRAWLDVRQSFEDAWDEWSAMEAVVKLEMLLEAEGLLIEDKPAPASTSSLQNPARRVPVAHDRTEPFSPDLY